MNDQKPFERFLSEQFDDVGPGRRMPDATHDDLLSRARGSRQRPQWLALIKEPPMRISSSLAVGSPMARIVAITVATLLLALMIVGAGVAGSRLLAADGSIVVDQDGNGTFETITEAVAMADDGDTILVRPGTYDESVMITEDITIRGDGDNIEDIVVELSVEMPLDTESDTLDFPAAFQLDGSNATLENLTLRGDSSRIVINGGAPLLKGLFLDGIGMVFDPNESQGAVPSGVRISDGSTATLEENVLAAVAVDIVSGSSPTLLRNEFSDGDIWMEGAGIDAHIEENTFQSSVKWAIAIWGGARADVVANTILDAETGVYLDAFVEATPVIRGNTISESQTGIYLESRANASIDGNTLADNAIGLSLDGGAAPVLTDNVFCGNQLDVAGPFDMPAAGGNEISETCPG